MHDQTTTILSLIDMLKHSQAKLAKEFTPYLTDTSVPLLERWSMFQRAPSDIKHHDEWADAFIVLDKYQVVLGDHESNRRRIILGLDRRRRLDTQEIVDRIVDEHRNNGEEYDYNEDEWREFINGTMEYFLSRKLGSVTYDW